MNSNHVAMGRTIFGSTGNLPPMLDGTSIMSGRGHYTGAALIVLLQSMLTAVQMPDADQQIIYGPLISVMLPSYGEEAGSAADRGAWASDGVDSKAGANERSTARIEED